jgi:hypothetical protein
LSYGFPTFQVGGRNTVLVDALTRRIPLVSDRPTIIFGADVTHPHPGEDSSPSIAAVSAALAAGKIGQNFCYFVVKLVLSSRTHRRTVCHSVVKVLLF